MESLKLKYVDNEYSASGRVFVHLLNKRIQMVEASAPVISVDLGARACCRTSFYTEVRIGCGSICIFLKGSDYANRMITY